MNTVSLYTGAGGLDLGLEAAGFEPLLCIESDESAKSTLRLNRPGWRLLEPGDIHGHRPDQFLAHAGVEVGDLDLLVAGPPCQPFSKARYWVNGTPSGVHDERASTLDAYVQAADTFLPRALLVENVGGILRNGPQGGLDTLVKGLCQINQRHGTRYAFSVLRLDAASFGAPQKRVRAYLVAHRDGASIEPPTPTHGLDSTPFITAWDAIGDLDSTSDQDDFTLTGKWADLLPSIPEGWNYLWHTSRGGGLPLFGWRTRFWSFLLKLAKDRPSWTLSAWPGPATGPFHWRSRQLSVRELSRLQTFPDDYDFVGTPASIRRQIGNATPPIMGEVVGRLLASRWFEAGVPESYRYLIKKRVSGSCPQPEAPTAVPAKYLALRGNHPSHPGAGQGPRAALR
jgi:DNA (cytosine-5)-methyltransferase 1